MELECSWRRPLQQVVNNKAFLVLNGCIYAAEKKNKLSKIDIATGEAVWSATIPDTWGWLCHYETDIIYMTQSGNVLFFDDSTGDIKNQKKIRSFYPGYILPTSNALISGGWRGYSDLSGFEPGSFDLMWTKKTRNKSLQKFSVPSVIKGKLLSINHSLQKLEIIDLCNGTTCHSITLPGNLSCPDLDKSYQIIDGKVTFVSSDALIHTLSDDFESFSSEKINDEKVATTLPFFSKSRIIYEDGKRNFCLYDRALKKVLWRKQISNNFTTKAYACELSDGIYLVGGSLGHLKVFSETGEEVAKIKSEKRITTNFIKVKDHILFGNKTEIVVLKIRS